MNVQDDYLEEIADRFDDEELDWQLADKLLELITMSKSKVQRAFLLRMQGRTFDEIAEEIGVNKSAIIRYFRSKKMQSIKEAVRKWIQEGPHIPDPESIRKHYHGDD